MRAAATPAPDSGIGRATACGGNAPAGLPLATVHPRKRKPRQRAKTVHAARPRAESAATAATATASRSETSSEQAGDHSNSRARLRLHRSQACLRYESLCGLMLRFQLAHFGASPGEF